MSAGCNGCGEALGPKNETGRCRTCAARAKNADAEQRRMQRAGILRKNAEDPGFVERRNAAFRHAMANLPESERERRREHGRMLAATVLKTPEARAAYLATREEAGRKRSETVMAWCPPEWRARYRELCKKGRKAADARRIVLHLAAGGAEPIKHAQQKSKLAWCPPDRLGEYRSFCKSVGAAEARRIIEADMTPFERQLARVRTGAKLIEVRPLRRLSEPTVTLGGVPSSYL